MLLFHFLPTIFRLKNQSLCFSMKIQNRETSTVQQCLSICQFKIEHGCAKKRSKILFSPAKQRGIRKGWNGGSEKAARSAAPCERIGPIRTVGSRTRSTINPGGFAMEFLRSWSELGVALRLERERAVVWFISNRFSRNRDNSPALNFYFSPRSPCPTPPPSVHHRHPCSFLLLHRDRQYTGTARSGCVTRCCYIQATSIQSTDMN